MAPSQTDSNAGQHLFTPVSHPELHKLGRRHIHKFLRERERYLLRILDVNSSGGSLQPVSIKSSIDPDLLLSLVEFGEFDNITTVSSLSEDTLKSWLEQKDAVELSSLSVGDLDATVRSNVRMNIHGIDPELRIKTLFIDYKNFLRSRKWE